MSLLMTEKGFSFSKYSGQKCILVIIILVNDNFSRKWQIFDKISTSVYRGLYSAAAFTLIV